MNAYAYLRVSGKGQLDGDGFTQALAIERYSQANEIEIINTFEERGVTGEAYAENRPAWSDMLMACTASGVSCILVEKLERLARNLMVQETLLLDLKRAGITMISTCEPDLCATDPTRVVTRQMLVLQR
jgi:DNA invertase Pin-like site-specific DNA recombinase